MMIRLLSAELLKLRRSKMFIVSLVGILSAPIMNFLLFIAIKNQLPDNIITFHDYLRQINGFIALIIGPLLFGLIAIYIFNREHQENTFKNLFSIPVNRTQLIISKFIILFGWIAILMFLTFIISALLGLTGFFTEVNFEVFFQHFKAYLLCGLLLFILTPTTVLVGLIFKNYVYPIVFTISVTFIGLITINSKYAMLYPWTIPFVMIDQEAIMKYPVLYSCISLGLVSIVTISSILIYINKADIQ